MAKTPVVSQCCCGQPLGSVFVTFRGEGYHVRCAEVLGIACSEPLVEAKMLTSAMRFVHDSLASAADVAVAANESEREDAEREEKNQERAKTGKLALALHSAASHDFAGNEVLDEIARTVNLTEAPEDALSSLLTDLRHYAFEHGLAFDDCVRESEARFAKEVL